MFLKIAGIFQLKVYLGNKHVIMNTPKSVSPIHHWSIP